MDQINGADPTWPAIKSRLSRQSHWLRALGVVAALSLLVNGLLLAVALRGGDPKSVAAPTGLHCTNRDDLGRCVIYREAASPSSTASASAASLSSSEGVNWAKVTGEEPADSCDLLGASSVLKKYGSDMATWTTNCNSGDVATWNAVQLELAHELHKPKPALAADGEGRKVIAVHCDPVMGTCMTPTGGSINAWKYALNCEYVNCYLPGSKPRPVPSVTATQGSR